ncbi:galactose oxidase-like domain-containing protein [Streptomyces sp. NPDC003011]
MRGRVAARAGHAFLPNGMLGVFGGNLGGNGGSGAKLSLVFDPWTETWHRNADSRDGNTLTLRTPKTAADAPPGWRTLFLLDKRGVPSVAKWVKLEPAQATSSPGGADKATRQAAPLALPARREGGN